MGYGGAARRHTSVAVSRSAAPGYGQGQGARAGRDDFRASARDGPSIWCRGQPSAGAILTGAGPRGHHRLDAEKHTRAVDGPPGPRAHGPLIAAAANFKDVTPAARRRILCENAKELYGL